LKWHILPNDLFLYLDGVEPRRLVRDWLFDSSSLILPEKVLVDKSILEKENKFKDSSISAYVITELEKEGVIEQTPKPLKDIFSDEVKSQVSSELKELIISTKLASKGVRRIRRDVVLWNGKKGPSILNPICAQTVGFQTRIPPLDAEWRRPYYDWRFDSVLSLVKDLFRREETYRVLIKEYTELEKPQERILARAYPCAPIIEIIPDPSSNKEFYRKLESKSPEARVDHLWKTAEYNLGKVLEARENDGVDSMREKVDEWTENARTGMEYTQIRKELKDALAEYKNLSSKTRLLRGFSWGSTALLTLVELLFHHPASIAIPPTEVVKHLLLKRHEIKLEDKSKERFGWFYWLNDSIAATGSKLMDRMVESAKWMWEIL